MTLLNISLSSSTAATSTDTQLYDENHDHEYNGVPINTEYCPITIRIYPSQNMENVYMTDSPRNLTLITAFIFILTSAVFFNISLLRGT